MFEHKKKLKNKHNNWENNHNLGSFKIRTKVLKRIRKKKNISKKQKQKKYIAKVLFLISALDPHFLRFLKKTK